MGKGERPQSPDNGVSTRPLPMKGALMEKLEQFQAFNLGAHFALMGAISALIETHPRREQLGAALERNRQGMLVTLTTQPHIPDEAAKAFHMAWERMLSPAEPLPRMPPA